MQNITKRLTIWAVLATLILILLLTMQFTDEVQWGEMTAYGILLLLIGVFYELWQWLKTQTKNYRIAFGAGLVGALLLFWVNGAIGIIGSEDNPANLMYGAVFAVGLIGSLVARFKPYGMMLTASTATIIQLLIPFFALFVWPAKASWGDAGVIGVFIVNFIFAIPFIVSAIFFRRTNSQSH